MAPLSDFDIKQKQVTLYKANSWRLLTLNMSYIWFYYDDCKIRKVMMLIHFCNYCSLIPCDYSAKRFVHEAIDTPTLSRDVNQPLHFSYLSCWFSHKSAVFDIKKYQKKLCTCFRKKQTTTEFFRNSGHLPISGAVQ